MDDAHTTKPRAAWIRSSGAVLLWSLCAMGILVIWALPRPNATTLPRRESSLKTDIANIASALQSYAADHNGCYPATIDQLHAAGYIPEMPFNPYNGVATSRVGAGDGQHAGASTAHMQNVALGDNNPPGNFTYRPLTVGKAITGYCLIGYGRPRNHGLDLDADGVGDDVSIVVMNGTYGNVVLDGNDRIPADQLQRVRMVLGFVR